MAASRPLPFGNFSGIDLRMNKEAANRRSLRQATNVDLTLGGGLKCRDGMRPVVTLDAQSKGLYTLNGSLRSVIPSGQNLAGSVTGEVQVIYDAIGTSSAASYSTGTVAVTANNATVTLTTGTWPSWVDEDTRITVASSTVRVAVRVSNTVIELTAGYPGVTASGLSYVINGLQPVAYPLNTIDSLAAVEAIGANAAFGVYPYVCVKKTNGTYEHHWIRKVPASVSVGVKTRVALPFNPGAAMIKLQEKIWASDNTNGVVRFSSTANGPTDWVAPLDAGFLPVLSHVSGSREVYGFGFYDNKLAVMFEDTIQLWNVNADPTLISLARVMSGPGSKAPNSIRNVAGDLFYFSQGGFRSLYTVLISGQLQEDDGMGAGIQPLTKLEDPTVTPPVALWSQTRGQYLCAFGSTVYVYRYSPKLKLTGWTTYELGDAAVTDMCELDGFVYLRAGTAVYRLDPAYDDNCTFTVQPAWTDGGNPSKYSRYEFMELVQDGACQIAYRVNPRDETQEHAGPTIDGSTTTLPLIAMGVMSQALSLVFTGTDKAWQLDRFILNARPLGR